MKTTEEMIKEVLEIKKQNRLISKRIEALKIAGYDYVVTDTKSVKKYSFYQYVSCSRDWNKTYGYAVIK